MISIIHNPNCSKSNTALQYLKDLNQEILIRDYLDVPLKKEEISSIVKMLNITPHELLRKNEALYHSLIENKNLSDDEILQLMADNPILIERPIIIKDEKAVIARPLEKLKDFMK